MTSRRSPRRLYRALGLDVEFSPLFMVTLTNATVPRIFGDDEITSITMTRGSQGATGGITPATCQVTVNSAQPVTPFDAGLSVQLSPYAAQRLSVPASSLRRWTGRFASQQIDDISPSNRLTTYTAGAWSNQVPLRPIDQALITGQNIGAVLEKAWGDTKVPAAIHCPGFYDTTWFPEGSATIAGTEFWDKFTRDIGILLRNRRDGSAEAIGLEERNNQAIAWRKFTPTPLTRRQCLSPAQWTQPLAAVTSIEWTHLGALANGTRPVITETVTRPVGANSRPVQVQTLDTTHAAPITHTQQYQVQSEVLRGTSDRYRVEKLDIDLLLLLRSSVPVDRALFLQLLEMEEGDPIALSWDWPADVAGIYFATEITETITPDAWTISLTIDPVRNITGNNVGNPTGDTWDTSYPPGTGWDAPAIAPTWDTERDMTWQ